MAKGSFTKHVGSRQTRVKAVIFDLDGTLIHSAVDFTKLKRETISLLADKGLPAKNFSTDMRSYDIMFLASELFRKKGLTEKELAVTRKKIEAIWNRVELESVGIAAPIEGVKETLLRLRKHGLKIGIVTRGCRAYAIKTLKTTSLLSMVDLIVGRDDVPESKPCPEPLMKAVEALGLKAEEAVMVGDNVDDVQCAQGAKVRFVGVKSEALTAETIRNLKCEVLLEDLGDLDALLI